MRPYRTALVSAVGGLVLLAHAARAQIAVDAYDYPYYVGQHPQGNLIFRRGHFYGSGMFGMYQLTPPAHGSSSWTVVSANSTSYGGNPVAGVAIDPAGTLYGSQASDESNEPEDGAGEIVSNTPPVTAGGLWTTTTLYSFPNGIDARSYGSIIRAPNGVLYGTVAGWTSGSGAVYSLTPPAPGQTGWTFATLHVFADQPDGNTPLGGVIRRSDGTLLGTTQLGGQAGRGTVFALTPPATAGGAWQETILYSFKHLSDGAYPICTLAVDSAGAIYGTTYEGGTGSGTVFKLTPPTSGSQWTETVLSTTMTYPVYGPTVGPDGIIYAPSNDHILTLTPSPATPGHYTETTTPVGSGVSSGLLIVGGYVVGTTEYGGAEEDGSLYYLTN